MGHFKCNQLQRDVGWRDWTTTVGPSTNSKELATIAFILAMRKAEKLGADPSRIILEVYESITGNRRWQLVWLHRTPHPVTGLFKRRVLIVDWATLELLE